MTDAPRPPAEPRWIGRFRSELVRGHHVVLYGNIHDLVVWGGCARDTKEIVMEHLRQALYRVIGSYDPIDGLTFADDETRERFGRLSEPPRAAPAVPVEEPARAPSGARDAEDTERAQRAQRARERMQGSMAAAPTPVLREPVAALVAIRTAMRQDATPCAFVLDMAEAFVQGPVHASRDDRHLVALLKRLMLDASLTGRPGTTRMRNLVVVLASELAQVPAWLYQREPLVAAVEVDLPSYEERLGFVIRGLDEFHGSASLPPERANEVAEIIANLTEGAALHDLDALKRTSVFEQVPVTEPRDLVQLHKFGRRDDPWRRVMTRLPQARALLSERVIGQPAAVESVVDMLTAASVGIDFVSDPHSVEARPKGVFLFVGPTGVGKTELAKALSVFLFDSESALARFDMSGYSEPQAAERLAGSPPGYVGHERGGELTNRVFAQPFSILLFDEIEKANGAVWDKFLQVLEDGRLTDGLGRTAYFSQTVVIFTSNIGATEVYAKVRGGASALPPYKEVAADFRASVERYFTEELRRPELLGRLGDGIVAFDLLRPDSVGSICRKFVRQLVAETRRRRGLDVVVDEPSVVAYVQARMAAGDMIALGARRIRPLLAHSIRTPLVTWITREDPTTLTHVGLRIPAGSDQAVVSVD
jgi:energy-coupling factor transporter ATP-binding protein EcfA2